MKAENILNLNLTSEDMICYINYAYDQFFDFSYVKNLVTVNFDGLLWLNDATFSTKNAKREVLRCQIFTTTHTAAGSYQRRIVLIQPSPRP